MAGRPEAWGHQSILCNGTGMGSSWAGKEGRDSQHQVGDSSCDHTTQVPASCYYSTLEWMSSKRQANLSSAPSCQQSRDRVSLAALTSSESCPPHLQSSCRSYVLTTDMLDNPAGLPNSVASGLTLQLHLQP